MYIHLHITINHHYLLHSRQSRFAASGKPNTALMCWQKKYMRLDIRPTRLIDLYLNAYKKIIEKIPSEPALSAHNARNKVEPHKTRQSYMHQHIRLDQISHVPRVSLQDLQASPATLAHHVSNRHHNVPPRFPLQSFNLAIRTCLRTPPITAVMTSLSGVKESMA